jgi:hypothetical protein
MLHPGVSGASLAASLFHLWALDYFAPEGKTKKYKFSVCPEGNRVAFPIKTSTYKDVFLFWSNWDALEKKWLLASLPVPSWTSLIGFKGVLFL